MNIDNPFLSFRRRPESSGFNDLLDPGLRRNDVVELTGQQWVNMINQAHPLKSFGHNLRRLLALLVLALFTLSAQAGVATDRLNAFFAAKGGLRATFVQMVQAPAFDQPEISRGTLLLLRPNRFRWDYQEPYKQQIVADGKRLWLYDEELEQVVVKPLDAALGDTPAMLLSGGGSIEERFTLEELTDRDDGFAWVQLTPKQEDTGFEAVRLGFDAHDLRRMELVDGFGQVTRMQFSDVARDAKISPAAFRFVPPPGVDVIGDPGMGNDARP